MQRLSYDLPFLAYRARAPAQVVLVYLDEESARSLGQSLNDVWDRSLHTRLLQRLKRDEAKLVLYDIVFSSPSADPSVDRELAVAMRDHGAVILGGAFEAVVQQGVFSEIVHSPTEVLREAAAGWGLLLFDPVDPDYSVRQLPGGKPENPTASWAAAERLGAEVTRKPEDRLRSRWLRYYGPPETFPSVSFHQALREDGVAPGFFRDRIVMMGGRPVTSGLTLGHDEFANPYSRWGHLFMTGLEVHATEFSNLLRGDWLRRMPRALEVTLLIVCGIVIGGLATFVSPGKGLTGMVLVAIVVAAGSCWLVSLTSVWFNWLIPVLVQVPLGIMWSVGTQSFFEAKKRGALRQAFSLYLSPHMADRIAASEFDLKPGAQVVEATVVFTDLKGFTAVADELNDPLRLSQLLIDYFTQTSQCLLKNDGTIIKYLGDAVLAAWGAPLPDPDHAGKAALAACQLSEASKLVVAGRVLTTRVGLSTGPVAAGNIGSPFRFDYTVIGDTVNLAFRLEGLNKLLGTTILMSASTRERLRDSFVTRYVGHFLFPGKAHGVAVHELIGPRSEKAGAPTWLATFENAFTAIKAGAFEEARALLRQTAWERGGEDGPSKFYLQKIDELEKRGDLRTWTGSVELPEK